MPNRDDDMRDALLALAVDAIRVRTAIGEMTRDVFDVRPVVVVKSRRALVPAPALTLDQKIADHTSPRSSRARLSGRASGHSDRQRIITFRFGLPHFRTDATSFASSTHVTSIGALCCAWLIVW